MKRWIPLSTLLLVSLGCSPSIGASTAEDREGLRFANVEERRAFLAGASGGGRLEVVEVLSASPVPGGYPVDLPDNGVVYLPNARDYEVSTADTGNLHVLRVALSPWCTRGAEGVCVDFAYAVPDLQSEAFWEVILVDNAGANAGTLGVLAARPVSGRDPAALVEADRAYLAENLR